MRSGCRRLALWPGLQQVAGMRKHKQPTKAINECSGSRRTRARGTNRGEGVAVLWQDTRRSVSYAHLNGVINIYENSPSSPGSCKLKVGGCCALSSFCHLPCFLFLFLAPAALTKSSLPLIRRECVGSEVWSCIGGMGIIQ